MQLSPGAALFCFVLTNFPFALAEDFQPTGIKYEVLYLFGLRAEFYLKTASTPGKYRIMRSRERDTEHSRDGADHALSLAQGQVEDLTKSQAGEYRCIRILVGSAATAR